MMADVSREAWVESDPRTKRPAASRVPLDDGAVRRALGYNRGGGNTVPDHVAALVDRLRASAMELMAPRLLWTTVYANVQPRAVICSGERAGRMAIGELVATELAGSEALVIFVATIGDALEREARTMMSTDRPLDGFVLDAIGSVAADACVDLLAADVVRAVEPLGWQTTNRFSPGYCTWPTCDQHALFGLLPPEPAGVHLSVSGLMQPIKSVSGVIGVGADVSFNPYPCAFCGMEDCRQRLIDSRI